MKEKSQGEGMKKKMECKAHGEAKYRSNLMVVRILANRATQSDRFFFAPIERSRVDALLGKLLELVHYPLPVGLIGHAEPA